MRTTCFACCFFVRLASCSLGIELGFSFPLRRSPGSMDALKDRRWCFTKLWRSKLLFLESSIGSNLVVANDQARADPVADHVRDRKNSPDKFSEPVVDKVGLVSGKMEMNSKGRLGRLGTSTKPFRANFGFIILEIVGNLFFKWLVKSTRRHNW